MEKNDLVLFRYIINCIIFPAEFGITVPIIWINIEMQLEKVKSKFLPKFSENFSILSQIWVLIERNKIINFFAYL